jgi:23S rRNA (cytosine1962-C5)-methyltransferase
MNYPIVYLKKNEDRRLRAGHLWIYSNEIDVQRSPLKSFKVGQLVNITSYSGRPLGTGYINPSVLLCVRLLTEQPNADINTTFFADKITKALQVRDSYFAVPCYRLIFGESDGLPGLVVDRYNDTLVMQINSAGMEALKDTIVAALKAVLNPQHILIRADGGARDLENLPKYTEVAFGNPTSLVNMEENGVKFTAPIFEGQKTGWFYDHRLNRANLKSFVKDKRVLDVFSYIGGWGVQAACFGASHVTCIDSSAKALALVKQHAELNNVQDKITTIEQDAFAALDELITAQQQFDVIILDPPAFIKRRKDMEAGKQAYHRINELALKLLKNPGILISASCSMHLSYEDLIDVVRSSARRQHCHARILIQGHQGPDHPVHPAIEETDYLKSLIVHVE